MLSEKWQILLFQSKSLLIYNLSGKQFRFQISLEVSEIQMKFIYENIIENGTIAPTQMLHIP